MSILKKAAKTFAPVSKGAADKSTEFACSWFLHKREIPSKLLSKFEVEGKKK